MTHILASLLWVLVIGFAVAVVLSGIVVIGAELRLRYLRWRALKEIKRVIQQQGKQWH